MTMKPSIMDQMEITKEWWAELNINEDARLALGTIKKFIVKKQFTTDLEAAEKVIFRYIGKRSELDFDEFYMLFSKGIFKTALLDMLWNIEELTKQQQGLPLFLKLGAFRRSLMLAGLDKLEGEEQAKGKSILYALQIFKQDVKPELFADLDFEQYCRDPLGREKHIDAEKKDRERAGKHANKIMFERIKKQGAIMGVDTEDIEKKLRGEDDETMKRTQKEMQPGSKSKFSKSTKKFNIDNLRGLQTINENAGEFGGLSSDDSELISPTGSSASLTKGVGQRATRIDGGARRSKTRPQKLSPNSHVAQKRAAQPTKLKESSSQNMQQQAQQPVSAIKATHGPIKSPKVEASAPAAPLSTSQRFQQYKRGIMPEKSPSE